MTKRTIFILTITLSLLAVGAIARAAMVKGTLAQVQGDVFLQPAGGAFAPVKNGAVVGEGDTLKTGADGTAILKWGDGHTMKIASLTLAKVDTLQKDEKTGASKSNFSIGQGHVLSRAGKLTADSAFTVKTPAAVAGVRGTGFDMGINPVTNQTSCAVVEGSVAVSAGGTEVVVAEGFQSNITEGEAPGEPVAIPPAQLQEMKTSMSELKTESEAAAPATTETKAAPSTSAATEAADKAIEAVQNNTVENATINAAINNAVENVCPAGGGCIHGDIELAR